MDFRFDFTGRNVLVFGGTTGINLGIAEEFARAGARVAVVSRKQSNVDAAVAHLGTISDKVSGHVTDVRDFDSVAAMFSEFRQSYGLVDVLVSGAAGNFLADVNTLSSNGFKVVVDIDLNGTFNVTRMAIPALRQSGNNPCIVIMSSVAGRFGYPNRSAYATSKWGLIGLTKTLSRELGEWGIRVNAILPGAVAGERIDKVLQARAAANGRPLDEEKAEAMKIQSLQRFVDPEDIAALACFLASDAGRSISGQLLPIDNDMQSAS